MKKGKKYSSQTMKLSRFLQSVIYLVLSGGYLAEIDTPEESEAVWEKIKEKHKEKWWSSKVMGVISLELNYWIGLTDFADGKGVFNCKWNQSIQTYQMVAGYGRRVTRWMDIVVRSSQNEITLRLPTGPTGRRVSRTTLVARCVTCSGRYCIEKG